MVTTTLARWLRARRLRVAQLGGNPARIDSGTGLAHRRERKLASECKRRRRPGPATWQPGVPRRAPRRCWPRPRRLQCGGATSGAETGACRRSGARTGASVRVGAEAGGGGFRFGHVGPPPTWQRANRREACVEATAFSSLATHAAIWPRATRAAAAP